MTFLLANWRLIGMALMLLGVGGYVLHCQSVKKSWNEAQAIAQRQATENARQALRDLKNKERTDENYQRSIRRLAADIKRLRDASTSGLSAPAAPADGSITATVEWAELGRAIREYREGVERARAQVLGLIERGAKAEEGLDEAKAWAQGR